MPETWLDVAVERFGEPRIAIAEPQNLAVASPWRRCWLWSVDGESYSLVLDTYPEGWIRLAVVGPYRQAELHTDGVDPADVDIRAACAFAWPGYRKDNA